MRSIVEFLAKKHQESNKPDLHVLINKIELLFDLLTKYFSEDLVNKPKLHIYDPQKDGLGKPLKVSYNDGLFVENWFELSFKDNTKFIVADKHEYIYFQYKFKRLAKWDGYSPTLYKSRLKLGMYFDEWLNGLPNKWLHGEIAIKKRFNISCE